MNAILYDARLVDAFERLPDEINDTFDERNEHELEDARRHPDDRYFRLRGGGGDGRMRAITRVLHRLEYRRHRA